MSSVLADAEFETYYIGTQFSDIKACLNGREGLPKYTNEFSAFQALQQYIAMQLVTADDNNEWFDADLMPTQGLLENVRMIGFGINNLPISEAVSAKPQEIDKELSAKPEDLLPSFFLEIMNSKGAIAKTAGLLLLIAGVSAIIVGACGLAGISAVITGLAVLATVATIAVSAAAVSFFAKAISQSACIESPSEEKTAHL